MRAFSLAKRTIRFLFLSKLVFISLLKVMIDFDFFTDYLSPLLAPYTSRRKIASKKRREIPSSFYNPRITWAILKYMMSAKASTIVVISGAAMIAGSQRSTPASSGSIAPTAFAITTVSSIASDTVSAIPA